MHQSDLESPVAIQKDDDPRIETITIPLEKSFKIGQRCVDVFTIPVNKLPNDQDWEFAWIDRGDGVKGIAVF